MTAVATYMPIPINNVIVGCQAKSEPLSETTRVWGALSIEEKLYFNDIWLNVSYGLSIKKVLSDLRL